MQILAKDQGIPGPLPTNECTTVDGLNNSINQSQLKIYQHPAIETCI